MNSDDLTSRKSNLSAAKRALLKKRLQGKADPGNVYTSIERRPSSGPQPLSYTQQRIWFLQQLFPNNTAYNMSYAWRVRGSLDISALQSALNEVAKRHESLRTTFISIDDEPQQRVADSIELQISRVDLRDLAAETREQKLIDQIKAEGDRVFDLLNGPLIQLTLFQLAGDDYVLTITQHHIITDEWSNDILWRELSAFYKSAQDEKSINLEEPAIQYSDYSLWQRKQVETGAMEAQLDYWQNELSGDLTLLQLPFDRPRSSIQSLRGGTIKSTLPAEILQALEKLSQESGTTLFMTLLAAYEVLLYRYSNQEELLIGTPIANRKRPETKDVIGMFINTVVLRADLTGNPSFSQLLQQVRQKSIEALANQDLPFDLLVQILHPERALSYNPLFQTMFVLQTNEAARGLPGATFEALEIDRGVSKFDLTMFAGVDDGRLLSALEYNSDLFDGATVERLLEHWHGLLNAIIKNPVAPIGTLSFLSTIEKELVVETWNDTAYSYPKSQTVHELISARALLQPDATAVIAADKRLTYGELEAFSNQLAHHLISEGVSPGMPVAIYMKRSADILVAILGTLKAGGAYVPLDPSYPAERISATLEDLDPSLIVTQPDLTDSLPPTKANVIKLNTDSFEGPLKVPQISVSADDLAYIIYTSGSTGKPKGVMVTHGNLLASTMARRAYYEDPVDRYLLLSPFAFDSSVAGIYWTMVDGGALVLPAPDQEKDVMRLIELIASEKVTHTLALPSLYRLFLEYASNQDLQSLQVVIVAGESCPPDLSSQHYTLLPGTTLYNEYGPTEATVWCSVYRLMPDDGVSDVPIGRPIANYNLYILDRKKQPVPIGVPGELYIGGAGVTRGYWRKPEMTADRFPTLSIDSRMGSVRVYRSGDLARWRADGEIEFLGRADNQVKIRGFRIELGEIESMLLQHPSIDESVVTAWSEPDDLSGSGKTLIAYVTGTALDPDSRFDRTSLRDHLRNRLPDYMLPQEIVILRTLPHTPNGKIDRKRLPRPTRDTSATSLFVEPQGDVEEKLARLWSEVLNVPKIGVHDNFFDLGGHSLLGVRLFAQIEEEFGARLSLNLLFQAPTIREMATALQYGDPEDANALLITIKSKGSRPPIFFAHGVYGGLLWLTNLVPQLDPRQPIYGLQSVGLQQGHEPDSTIEAMAERYIEAIRRVQPSGPYYLGGFCFGGLVVYEMARQLELLGEEIALLAIIEGSAPPAYHSKRPLFDPLRLQIIQQSAPHWFQGYEEFGGWRLKERLLAKLGLFSGEQQAHDSQNDGNIELDYLADFDAARPEIQFHIRELNYRAVHKYRPQPYGGSLTLFRARILPVGHALFGQIDPLRGWGTLAQGGITIRNVEGSHIGIITNPQVSNLAMQLNDVLDTAFSSGQ